MLESAENFSPHGYCLNWSSPIIWANALSDGVIVLSYYSIPIALLYVLSKRRDFPFPNMLIGFAAFILACGTTHLMSIINIWTPSYIITTVVKAVTAVLSFSTAAMLIPSLRKYLTFPSQAQLEETNKLLRQELEIRKQHGDGHNMELKRRTDLQIQALSQTIERLKFLVGD